MTVREVMEIMAQWDPEAEVRPCIWDKVVTIRACRGFVVQNELRLNPSRANDDEED